MRQKPDAVVLAFDFGTRRIGVAIGNTVTRTARPLSTVDTPTSAARFDAIAALIAQWRPSRLVVGLPVHADGTPHAMTARAKGFARDVGVRFSLPVALVDERFTTQAAQSALAASGRRGRAARAARDEAAAQIILQQWLDAGDDI